MKGITMVLRVSGGESLKVHDSFSIFESSTGNIRCKVHQTTSPDVLIEPKNEHWWIGLRLISGWTNHGRLALRNPEHNVFYLSIMHRAQWNRGDQFFSNLSANRVREISLECYPSYPDARRFPHMQDEKTMERNTVSWGKRLIEQNYFRLDSGKLNYPHRHWYMTIAKQCIGVVNEMNDENGISFRRNLRFDVNCLNM